MGIQVWAVRLDRLLTEQEAEELLRLMPEERRQRLMQVRDQSRWQEPLTAYALLRLALFRTAGLTEWPKLVWGERGKPLFPGKPELHFSLSHTGGAVLIGLSEKEIGVDVERLRPVSQRVQKRLDAAGETAEAYFRNWVRYEAAVKRTGEGVSPHCRDRHLDQAQLLDLFPGYCAAVSGTGTVTVVYAKTLEAFLADLAEK